MFTAGLDAFGGVIGTLLGSEERGGIFVMRPDGTGLRQLTSFRSFNFVYEGDIFHLPDDHPTVSPDGRRILFSSSRLDDQGVLGGISDEDQVEVFVMDVNGANIRRLTHSPGFDGEASFSPDGTRIAYVSQCAGVAETQCISNEDIYVMDPNGNILQRVTSSPLPEVEPAWSPDGRRIAYTVVTDQGGVILGDEEKEVVVADSDGLNKNRRLLTNVPGQDHDANFHPSGNELVITSERAGTFPYGDVIRIRADSGTMLANLTIDDRILGVGGGGDPAWSPDASLIAYIKAQFGILHGPQKIRIMNADGSGKRTLDRGIPGLVNIHQNWGVLANSDGDTTPDYLENTNTSFTRDAVAGFSLFGQQLGARSQPGEQFGGGIALADLTHDGRLDLIVGSPGLNEPAIPDSGGVAIVQGSKQGPQFAPTLLQSVGTLLSRLAAARPAPAAGGRFGQEMASGDFNGDGFRDVAIGAPGQNRVLALYGGLSSQTLNGTGEFGRALAAGDFNKDGRSDLAVGSPSEARSAPGGGTVSAGAVRIFFGNANGLSTSPAVFDQASLPVESRVGRVESGDRFGAALAVGHIDGNATHDLAIGVPREDVQGIIDAGVVHMVPGFSGQGLSLSQAVHRDAAALPAPQGGLQANALFGSAVAIGSFQGGLRASHLVVGAPGQDVPASDGRLPGDAGLVALFEGPPPFFSGADLLATAGTAWSAETLADALQAGGRFGEELAVGDISGDGVGDLAVSAPGQAVLGVAAGAVYLVAGAPPANAICPACGSGGGLQPSTAQRIDQASVGTLGEAGDSFGASLAIGDMDGDGQDDLFIGSQGEDGAVGPDTGLVSIRYGIDVGTFELTPHDSVVPAGGRQDLRLTWTHPQRWRDLDTVDVRIVGPERVLFWLRFDAAAGVLQLVEVTEARGRTSSTPESHGFLWNRYVALNLREAQLITSGPQGRHVTLLLPLRFNSRAPQGTYTVEVFATDVHGNSQGFEPAGTLEIRPR